MDDITSVLQIPLGQTVQQEHSSTSIIAQGMAWQGGAEARLADGDDAV